MPYQSVDQLKKLLVKKVFHYAKDSKKAAGRALGTLVEIITFYLLKSLSFEHSIAIERSLAEFGNPDITHNVEYSLHPILRQHGFRLPHRLPLSSSRIFAGLDKAKFSVTGFEKTGNVLLPNQGILRNSCVIASGPQSHLVVTFDSMTRNEVQLELVEQFSKPYAI